MSCSPSRPSTVPGVWQGSVKRDGGKREGAGWLLVLLGNAIKKPNSAPGRNTMGPLGASSLLCPGRLFPGTGPPSHLKAFTFIFGFGSMMILVIIRSQIAT